MSKGIIEHLQSDI